MQANSVPGLMYKHPNGSFQFPKPFYQPGKPTIDAEAEKLAEEFKETVAKQGQEEALKQAEVSFDPFLTANLDPGMLSTLVQKYGVDDVAKDYIGKPVMIHADETICNGHKMGKKLGQGGFGAVYLDANNSDLVLKSENAAGRSYQAFQDEIKVQNAAAEGGWTCPIHEHEKAKKNKHIYGREPQEPKDFYNLVMPSLACSLEDMQQDNFPIMDLESCQKLTAQMIMAIRDIHQTGYVHCDIKPANLMFKKVGTFEGTVKGCVGGRYQDVQKTYSKYKLQFIDFGLVEEITVAGQQREPSKRPKGTPNYMSRNCHNGFILTRRDDLESIVYIVIMIVNSHLPWFNLKGDENKGVNEIMSEMKEEYWGSKLLQGLSPVFQEFVKYVTNLGADEIPDYDKLIDMMMTFEGKKMSEDDLFKIQWNKYINFLEKDEQECVFHRTRVFRHKERLGRFKYPRDDQMPNGGRDSVQTQLGYIMNNQLLYKGETHKETGKQHGRGMTIGMDGEIFEGLFVNGEKKGQGRTISIFYSCEGVFDGWNVRKDADMIYRFNNSEKVLVGRSRDCLMDNKTIGVMSYPNGDCIFGVFCFSGDVTNIAMEVREGKVVYNEYASGQQTKLVQGNIDGSKFWKQMEEVHLGYHDL